MSWHARKAVLLLTLAAGAAAACGNPPDPAQTSQSPTTLAEPTPTVSIAADLPRGDAVAGRQAFIDLRCGACHAVPSDPDMPMPVSDTPGPPIDARTAGKDLNYLATSIVSPSHAMSLDTPADVRARVEGALSPMSDFSGVMTVRQFVDVHAFIQSMR